MLLLPFFPREVCFPNFLLLILEVVGQGFGHFSFSTYALESEFLFSLSKKHLNEIILELFPTKSFDDIEKDEKAEVKFKSHCTSTHAILKNGMSHQFIQDLEWWSNESLVINKARCQMIRGSGMSLSVKAPNFLLGEGACDMLSKPFICNSFSKIT